VTDPVIEPFWVGAYWRDRPEEAAEVDGRVSGLLSALAPVHPALSAWWSDQDGSAVAPGTSALRAMIEGGRDREHDDLTTVGGFRFSMSNVEQLALSNAHEIPDDTPGLDLSFSCGKNPGFPVSDNCVLKLPAPDEAPDGLYDLETVSAVVDVFARVWQPDHAMATSFPLAWAQSEEKATVDVGWITYLGPRYAAHLTGGDLPAGLQAAELGEGLLIRIPRPAAEVTTDMVVDLRQHLVTAGALPPVD
jgi:hypothetical protein